MVLVAHFLDNGRQLLGIHILVEQVQQGNGHVAVQRLVIILEEILDVTSHSLGVSLDVVHRGSLRLNGIVQRPESQRKRHGLATAPARLTMVNQRFGVLVLVIPIFVHLVKDAIVFHLPVFVLINPLAESLFLVFTFFHHLVALELLHLANVVFPVVAHAGLFGGVLDEYGGVSVHVLAVLLQFGGAAVHNGGAFQFDDILHGTGIGVAVCAARVTENHGIITWLNAF